MSEIIVKCLASFVFGGALCIVGQLFIDFTKFTPGRILVAYVVSGVFLSAVGVYQPLVKVFGCGASVPLTGFGHLLAEGVRTAVEKEGALGIITGGITGAAAGITVAVLAGFVVALLSKPHAK